MNFAGVKSVSIPEGAVKRIFTGDAVLWSAESYTNRVPLSIDTDGSIFNGCGYMDGYRLSSSGATKVTENSTVTGYISASGGDVVRVAGYTWYNTADANYICAYDKDYNYIGAVTPQSGGTTYGTKMWTGIEDGGTYASVSLAELDNIAYIRVSCHTYTEQTGADMIVTVNEEIT